LDNKRQDALAKRLNEVQEWVDFSQTDRWLKLKTKIEEVIINPARDAFWNTEIETKSNEVLIRNTLSQRTTIRVAKKIIDLVEGHIAAGEEIKKELEQIEKHKNKESKNG
jgi:hypothetical protein